MFPHPRVGRKGADDEDAPRPASPAAGVEAEGEAGASSSAGGGADAGAGERLSLMELAVAELGGWAGAIFYRCHLPAGPFLVSDGVVHLDLAVFRTEVREHDEPSAPG